MLKKADDTDRIQLCAQVLCLEEMFGVMIECGQFYYLQEHRRSNEVIDALLREKTAALIERIMNIRKVGETATAKYEKRKCDNCSLLDLCMPKSAGAGHKRVRRFIETQLKLVEEFRPVIVDQLVLSLINRKQLGKKGFTKAASGAVAMDDGFGKLRRDGYKPWRRRKTQEDRQGLY